MCNEFAGLEGTADARLLEEVREGSSAAERALFDRYYHRLVRFACCKMGDKIKRIEPPSEIAHSAIKSVLMGIPAGRFRLDEGDSLWPLLVTITLHKICNRAKKRRPEELPPDRYELLADTGTAESEVELNDLVEELLAKFPERRRNILERILQGYRVHEIAEEFAVSERTVYSTRKQAEATLARLLQMEPD